MLIAGQRIVSGSGNHSVRDNSVKIWDANSGQELQTLTGHTDRVFDPAARTAKANEWDAYISLKLQAYVKGSKDTNGAWMDRVLLVRRK